MVGTRELFFCFITHWLSVLRVMYDLAVAVVNSEGHVDLSFSIFTMISGNYENIFQLLFWLVGFLTLFPSVF